MNDLTSRLISIHSYKGGVGKSTVGSLLAVALAKRGKRTCLVDLDLMAPGVHYILTGEHLQKHRKCILDYILGTGGDVAKPASVAEVCQEVTTPLCGADAVPLFLIPGRANMYAARAIQSYVLADVRAGLLQSRLEHLLAEARRRWKLDFFVLDSPPSLLGLSGGIHALVGRNTGAHVSVSTPTLQDLVGTNDMLSELAEEADGKRDRSRSTRAFVLNRWPYAMNGREPIRRVIADTLALANGRKKLTRSALLKDWLEDTVVALVPESDELQLLSRVRYANERRPQKVDVDSIDEVAGKLITQLDGARSK